MKQSIKANAPFNGATNKASVYPEYFREVIAYAQVLKAAFDRIGVGQSAVTVNEDGQRVQMFIAAQFNEPTKGPNHYTKQALAMVFYADSVAKKPCDIVVTPFRETGDAVSAPTSHQAPPSTFTWEQRNELVPYINNWMTKYWHEETAAPTVYEKLMRRADDDRVRNFETLIKRVANAVGLSVPAAFNGGP